jgi:transketolase C-terminal domain/subunit
LAAAADTFNTEKFNYMKSDFNKQNLDLAGITRRNLFEWAGLALTAATVPVSALAAFSSPKKARGRNPAAAS